MKLHATAVVQPPVAVFDDLVASNLPDDPLFGRALKAYFPQVRTKKYGPAIAAQAR